MKEIIIKNFIFHLKALPQSLTGPLTNTSTQEPLIRIPQYPKIVQCNHNQYSQWNQSPGPQLQQNPVQLTPSLQQNSIVYSPYQNPVQSFPQINFFQPYSSQQFYYTQQYPVQNYPIHQFIPTQPYFF